MKKNDYFELGNAKRNNLGNIKEENKYDYDEEKYEFDSNRKNDGHTAVIRQIKEKSTVLDIGCASGIIGKVLKEVKKCTVDGIEYDKVAFEVAKNKNIYRNIFNFSIADHTSKEFQEFEKRNNKYDYIIFADVLEHLIEPWIVLKNVSKFLKKDGKIIVSVPNIGHIDIIKGLLDGNFNYSELGVLDSTHLRFFTENSFIDMIENLGQTSNVYFSIKLCEKVLIKPPYIDTEEGYELFNIENNLEELFVLQNIFELTLVEKKEQAKVLRNNTKNNYFTKMNKQYKKMLEMVQELQQKNNVLEIEKKSIEKELNQIKTSTRWRFINKIGNWKNKITRH